MTKEEIENITTIVKIALQKTPVQVYDTNGELVSFFKEDVLSIDWKTTESKKVVKIKVANLSYDIIVPGTVNMWKNKLGFNPVILNDYDK